MENEPLYFELKDKDIKIPYSSLLEMLEKETFLQKYPQFEVNKSLVWYIIQNKEIYICVFKKIIEVKIIFKSKEPEIFKIHSSLDLENKCKSKNISINNLIVCETKILYNPFYLQNYIDNNKIIFELKEKEKLPEASHLFLLKEDSSYPVKNYSSFYTYYFKDNYKAKDKFSYIYNDVRKTIFANLLTVHFNIKIKTYKFTGPFSIGKSITLLQYCRILENAFYLNIKVLKKVSEIESYSILREEFSKINKIYFKDIQNLKEKNYYNHIEP